MSTTPPSPESSRAAQGRGSYRALLSLPGAAGFFLAAAIGRVGLAATGVGLIWLVTGSGASFALAGVVVAALAAGEALVAPQVARLVDRWGQTRVLPWVLTAHGAAVAAMVSAALTGCPAPVLVAAAGAAGASTPQLGALSVARWAALLADRRAQLPRAFAAESLANAIAFLLGPVLATIAATTGPPWAGSVGAGVVLLAGGCALALQHRSAPPILAPAAISSAARRRGGGGSTGAGAGLRSARFALVIALTAALGVHFGAVTLTITAWASEQHSRAAATALVAASGGAGLLGAAAYGARRWQASPLVQVRCASAVMALGCAGALTVSALGDPVVPVDLRAVALGTCVVVTGAVVPVVIIQITVITEAGLHRAVLTQALTWSSSVSAGASAASAALAGALVEATGATGGFALLTAVSTCLLLLTLTGRRPTTTHR